MSYYGANFATREAGPRPVMPAFGTFKMCVKCGEHRLRRLYRSGSGGKREHMEVVCRECEATVGKELPRDARMEG